MKHLLKYKNMPALHVRMRGVPYVILFLLIFCSCKKSFLDVVPDDVATIDNAFTSKVEAEKYLFTCYAYIPNNEDPTQNVGTGSSDELWIDNTNLSSGSVMMIGRNGQNTSHPYACYWDGGTNSSGSGMFKAIRDCNVFLDNISDLSKVPDLDLDTRIRWIAEAKFLKAYYHFILFRAYGPIPITDKNIPISAPLSETQVKRQPVDSVVNYIAGLLDSAAANLPLTILNTSTELGRVTKPIALSLKARLLVTAASPLFNGNSDYASFKDKNGTALFNTTYSVDKWKRAADACKDAIDACKDAGIDLYTFNTSQSPYALSDTTTTQLSIRNAMCEAWNKELIWGLTESGNLGDAFQKMGVGGYDNRVQNITQFHQLPLGPTLKMAKMFYTKNGVPITEDKTLDFSNYASLRVGTHAERFYIQEGETTARLNFDREPRYYADLGFDRGVWYMADVPGQTDDPAKGTVYWLANRASDRSNSIATQSTYFMKKVLYWKASVSVSDGSFSSVDYPYPEFRLADLYLLYSEALNEENATPTGDVYTYINLVRERAGIPDVQTAWTQYSNNPTKYTTQAGMRSIIHQERAIELCFEGQRYWDLMRWKAASQDLSGNVTGWDKSGETAQLFYRETAFYARQFIAPRDYLMPIPDNDLLNNPNLVQNPGW